MNSELAVREVMHPDLLYCSPDATVREAANAMFRAACGSIIVMAEGRAVGIWTERDSLALDHRDPAALEQPISAVMSSPVRTVPGATPVAEVGARFREEGIRHLVVVDVQEHPVGVVSQTDIILGYGVERYLSLRAVRSVMNRRCAPVTDAAEFHATRMAMHADGLDAVVVVNENNLPVAIFTERDSVRVLSNGVAVQRIGEVASRPVHTINQDDSLWRARNLALERGIRHLLVTDDDGHLVGILSFADLLGIIEHEYVQHLETLLHEREQALAESRQHLQLAHRIIESSLDGVVVTDADGHIEMVNPAFTRLTGYRSDEVVGKTPAVLKSGHHDSVFYDELWRQLKQKGYWQGEIWNRRKTGEIYPEWLTITAVQTQDGSRKYAAVFNDISERKKSEEHIRTLAYYDMVTELPNRRLFYDRLGLALKQAKRRGSQVALLFIDLDLFKEINDRWGHMAGDTVLVEVAARLKRSIRSCDTVGRIAGDEFAVLAPDIRSATDAIQLAARALDSTHTPVIYENRQINVTLSIGIALYPDHSSDMEALVRAADRAMYQSKEKGRARYTLYVPSHLSN